MMIGTVGALPVVVGLVLLLTGVTVVVPPVECHTTWDVSKLTVRIFMVDGVNVNVVCHK